MKHTIEIPPSPDVAFDVPVNAAPTQTLSDCGAPDLVAGVNVTAAAE